MNQENEKKDLNTENLGSEVLSEQEKTENQEEKENKSEWQEFLKNKGENDSVKKVNELNDSLLRLKADFDNFRKRTQKEKEDLANMVKVNVVSKFLPVLDNFERGLASLETQDSVALKTGMDMVYKQLKSFIEEIGVEKIEAKGQKFDPQFHQAVLRVEDDTQEENIVIEELQSGYKIADRLIRPSMVKVTS